MHLVVVSVGRVFQTTCLGSLCSLDEHSWQVCELP